MKVKIIRAFTLIIVCIAVMAFISDSEVAKKPIYLNTSYSFEERAADLVSRFTIEEKQSLLGNTMAAVPRLGLNTYFVWGSWLEYKLSG